MSPPMMERSRGQVLLALALSAIAFDVSVLAWGQTPAVVAHDLIAGTWGTPYGAAQVVFKTTSTLLAAVAARIALRAGLFAIGTEGSIAIASLAVGALGAMLPPEVSRWIAWPALTIVAAIAGAMWAAPAAILRARFGAHEVISGIMLNRIATGVVGWALARGLADKASVHTHALPDGARFPRLGALPGMHALAGSAANVSTVVAIALACAVPWLARRTVVGRELRAVGASPSASRATGVRVGRRWIQALLFAGAVAGLCALNDVMGFKGYAEEGVGAGTGFAGLAAALIGGDTALGLIGASVLLATLSQGGLAINARVPRELIDALTAVVLLLIATAPRLSNALSVVIARCVPTTAVGE